MPTMIDMHGLNVVPLMLGSKLKLSTQVLTFRLTID